MADFNRLATTYKKLFENHMKKSMHDLMGGKLRKYCELKTEDTMEAVVFFRSEGQKARDRAPNFYSDTNGAYMGVGEGDAKGKRRFEVKPTYCYWGDKMDIIDIHKSMFKPTDSFMTQAIESLALKEDLKIVQALETKFGLGKHYQLGDNTKVITDDANITAYRLAVALILGRTQSATSGILDPGQIGCAMINFLDYASLMSGGGGTGSTDLLTNANFTHITGRNGMIVTMLFGMPLEIIGNFMEPDDWNSRLSIVPRGKVYMIPKNAIGFAEWEGTSNAEAKYDIFNEDTMSFVAKKSGGAVAIDIEFTVEFSFLADANLVY